MGSDMMIMLARAPRFNAAAERELVKLNAERNASRKDGRYVLADRDLYSALVTHVGIARASVLDLDPDDFSWHEEYLYDDPDHVYPEAQLHRWFGNAIRDVFHNYRRQVTEISPDGVTWLATGGGSWGDVPTDVYQPIAMLDIYGIFNKPITVTELRAAIRALEAPQQVVTE